jgi:DUF1707 SHOCT-like domain
MRPPRPGTKPALRIGDAEREEAVADLGRHFAEGRLTPLEHEERTALALQARTGADLGALFADLPLVSPTREVTRRPWTAQAFRIGWRLAAVALVVALLVGALHVVQVILVVALVALALRWSIGRRGGGHWHRTMPPHQRPW